MLSGAVTAQSLRPVSRGRLSSSRLVTESICTSLRTAARAMELQRRLFPVSKSSLVRLSAKVLITHVHCITDSVIPGWLLPPLAAEDWLAPLTVVLEGRVATGDEIGERSGLSAPGGLCVHLTWDPHPGRTGAEGNCISNVRTEGAACRAAARPLHLFDARWPEAKAHGRGTEGRERPAGAA